MALIRQLRVELRQKEQEVLSIRESHERDLDELRIQIEEANHTVRASLAVFGDIFTDSQKMRSSESVTQLRPS